MKNKLLLLSLVAAAMLMTSCASKKDLLNCQNENRSLTEKFQDAKDQLANSNAQLAASNARVTSLEEQLAQAKADYARLQASLDKSL